MKNRKLAMFIAAGAATARISMRVYSQAGTATLPQTPAQATPLAARTYVGSALCGTCHKALYDRWSKTRMANVVTDPKVLSRRGA